MPKAQFQDNELAAAVAEFAIANPAREAPATGKNSNVLIYGENRNVYKPIIEKVETDVENERIGAEDIGTEFSGLD